MPTTRARNEVKLPPDGRPPARRTEPVRASDAAFVALQEAYHGSGGLERGDALVQRLSVADPSGCFDLARRIIGGQVLSVQWQKDFWLPLFQFEPDRLVPREAPRLVLGELRGALDGWAIARWFVAPCEALGGETPLARLDSDLPAVLATAQAARRAAFVRTARLRKAGR
jgi:hypothetical protein